MAMYINSRPILIIFFFLTAIPAFPQTDDTIRDSHHTWIYFQAQFKAEYSDTLKHHFTQTEKRKIEDLLAHQLTLVDVTYLGYDNRIHSGQIICNTLIVGDLKNIFAQLLQLSFPVYQCKPISEFHFDDAESMQANNTTCFDFRLKTSQNGVSDHSYGFAIDINPVQNPYKRRSKTLPQNADENISAGRIRMTEDTGKKVIDIFKKHGWTWGGNWRSLKDFMHFQKKN